MSSITGLTGVVADMAKTTRIGLIGAIRAIIIRNTTLIIHNKPWMWIIASPNCYPEVINHDSICAIVRPIASVKTVVLSCIHIKLSIVGSARIQGTNSKKHPILILKSSLRIENSWGCAVTKQLLSQLTPIVPIIFGACLTKYYCCVANWTDGIVLLSVEGIGEGRATSRDRYSTI